MKHSSLVVALVFALAPLRSVAATAESVDIVASNVEGGHGEIAVQVRPSHDGRVHYHLVAVRGDAANVQLGLDRDGATTHVRATYTVQRGILGFLLSHDTYRLEVEAPSNDAVTARTDIGAVEADGPWPFFSAATGIGGVRLAGTPRVEARTGNGAIAVRGAQHLDARTGNGGVDVTLAGNAPDASIRTGNGAITVRLASGATPIVEAHTGNGGIDNPLTGAKGPGRLDLRTGNGGIGITVAH